VFQNAKDHPKMPPLGAQKKKMRAGICQSALRTARIMDEYQGFPWSPPRIAEEERELLRPFPVVLALLRERGQPQLQQAQELLPSPPAQV